MNIKCLNVVCISNAFIQSGFRFPNIKSFCRIPNSREVEAWRLGPHCVSVGSWLAGSWDTALAIVAWAGRHWPAQGTAAQTQTREQLYILSPEQPREAELSSQQVPRERLTVAREACQMSEAQLWCQCDSWWVSGLLRRQNVSVNVSFRIMTCWSRIISQSKHYPHQLNLIRWSLGSSIPVFGLGEQKSTLLKNCRKGFSFKRFSLELKQQKSYILRDSKNDVRTWFQA